jgi:hypothetical protein
MALPAIATTAVAAVGAAKAAIDALKAAIEFAERSCVIEIDNMTADSLELAHASHESGAFGQHPPPRIAPFDHVLMSSHSTAIAQGAVGRLGFTGRDMRLDIDFGNPFAGSTGSTQIFQEGERANFRRTPRLATAILELSSGVSSSIPCRTTGVSVASATGCFSTDPTSRIIAALRATSTSRSGSTSSCLMTSRKGLACRPTGASVRSVMGCSSTALTGRTTAAPPVTYTTRWDLPSPCRISNRRVPQTFRPYATPPPLM